MDMEQKKDTMLEQLQELQARGFAHEFSCKGNRMQDMDSGKDYPPAEIKIIEHYRFEGDSNPDDMSVVYALEAVDGTKGILIDAFGMYANPIIGECLQKIKGQQY